MNRTVYCWTLSVGAALGMVTAQAVALDPGFHFKAGYDLGGDRLATVVFTNGDTESIRANEGLFLGAGVSLVNDAQNLETELSLGVKFGGSVASNGDVTFTTFPAEALMFYRWSRVRAGGGIVYQLSPELEVDGAGASFASNTEYDDALGFIAQVEYRITRKLNVGLRYTAIEYDQKNTNASFDGNTFGVVFSGSL